MHNRDTSPIIIHEISSSRPAFKQPVIATLIPLEEQHHSENAKWRNKRPPFLFVYNLVSPQPERKRKKNDRVVSQSLRDRIVAIFFSSSFLFFSSTRFLASLCTRRMSFHPLQKLGTIICGGVVIHTAPDAPKGRCTRLHIFTQPSSASSLSLSASCTHVSVHIFFRYKSRNGRVNEAQKFIKSSHPFSRRGG